MENFPGTSLPKRWTKEGYGGVFTIRRDAGQGRFLVVAEPYADDDEGAVGFQVAREALEDHSGGWKPATTRANGEHGAWWPSSYFSGHDPKRCAYLCEECGQRCTRAGLTFNAAENAHRRHYHAAEHRDCPNYAPERDGYAIQRAREGDWSSWLIPDIAGHAPPKGTPIKVGQIWAVRHKRTGMMAVARICEEGTPNEILAPDRSYLKALEDFPEPSGSFDAVLVQDVGQEDPTLPSEMIAAQEERNRLSVPRPRVPCHGAIPINLKDLQDIRDWARDNDKSNLLMPAPRDPTQAHPNCRLVATPLEDEKPAYEPPRLTKIDARREVSQDGRLWCPYDMLIDADPFERYPWRRLVMPSGEAEILARPVPREETSAWRTHVDEDRRTAMAQYALDALGGRRKP
jgi:hypothetical protein